MEGSPHKKHEDHFAGKGMNSLDHYNLVHKIIPMLLAIKISDAQAAVEKELGKLEKIPAWQLTQVRNKSEVIAEARNEGRTVHFASLGDLCHLNNSELQPQFKKCKGRVVLRGDIVMDDSGSYAAFTEQGSSASQMTAAKVMDIIYPGPECPDFWIRLPKHKWPKSWSSMEDPVVPLERNLYGHPLAGLLWERQFENILLKHGWEKIPNWDCLFVHREKGFFLSVYVDDIKLAGKKQTLDPWTI